MGSAFAALDSDGAVYTWGLLEQGGMGGPEHDSTISIFGRSAETTNAVCVPGRNRAPIIVGAPVLNAHSHSLYEFMVTASDQDGSDIVFGLSNSPAWLSVDSRTGTVSGTPSDEDIGTAINIIVTATDHGGKSAALPAFDIMVEQISEENLVANLLQSKEFQVEQLNANGISGLIDEGSADYDSAFSEAQVVPTTLSELQLIVDTINERFNAVAPEATPIATNPLPLPIVSVGAAGSSAPVLLLLLGLGLCIRRQASLES